MNPVSMRLLSQHLICRQFCTPEEVVEWMGAMQAQDHKGIHWAVAMRTRKPSLKSFKDAFDSGKVVRFHLMRGTWQLVSAGDYWQMLDLCAPKALAVTKGWMTTNRISIPSDEAGRIRDILASTADRLGSATKEDFIRALAEKDIKMDDHRLSYHIRLSEMSGVLCSGNMLPLKATYALAGKKLPARIKTDRDEALMMLTRKYFRSRQPATLEDFSWWSGLNKSDCIRGISLLGDWLHVERWRGRDFYLSDDCRTRGYRNGVLLLLPPYDEYLISYKSRDIAVPQEHTHRAHNNSGNFWPVILVDGKAAGNWSMAKDRISMEFFREGLPVEPHALEKEVARYDYFISH